MRDLTARDLRDMHAALHPRARAGWTNPGAVDARRDQRQILGLGRARLHGVEMFFARQLRAQVRFALHTLLLEFALLRQRLRLAVGLGLGGSDGGAIRLLSLGGRGPRGFGLLGRGTLSLLALLLLGGMLLLRRTLLLLDFFPR